MHDATAELARRLRPAVTGARIERGDQAGWRLLGLLRWLALLGALAGTGWLVARLVGHSKGGLGLPILVAVAGLALWLLIALLSGPAVAARSRAARLRAERQLRSVVGTLTREYLVDPVRQMLGRYAQAREALRAVGR